MIGRRPAGTLSAALIACSRVAGPLGAVARVEAARLHQMGADDAARTLGVGARTMRRIFAAYQLSDNPVRQPEFARADAVVRVSAAHRSYGLPRSAQRCSACDELGHNRRTCTATK